MCYSGGIEVVYHPSFAARCGTFNPLARPALEEGDDAAALGICGGEIPLEDKPCNTLFFLRWFQPQPRHHLLADHGIYHHKLTGGLLLRHLRPSKGPACAATHIHLHTQTGTLFDAVAQEVHPTLRQERHIVLSVALHAIYRRDFHGTDALGGILFQAPAHVLLIHRRTHPPPAGARLGRGCRQPLADVHTVRFHLFYGLGIELTAFIFHVNVLKGEAAETVFVRGTDVEEAAATHPYIFDGYVVALR